MIGQTILHYKIIEKLGGGGMGVVYKAMDTKLDRFVALKFLPHHISHDEDEKKRFIREAKAASALDHSNICTIYDINETDPDPNKHGESQMFIAMAYYDGETLKKRVADKELTVDQILDITIQIARGLKKAHDNKIIHRDIKPANILITKGNDAKIVDFGLAKLHGQTLLTKTGTTMGTVAYMSPEQVHGDEADHRSDIWSLGVVLYEMLTGQLPFVGEYEQAIMYSIVNNDFQPLKEFDIGGIEEYQNIIGKALSKELEHRYQNMDELITDLELLKEGSSREIKSAQRTKKEKAKFRKIIYSTVSVIIVIASIVTVGILYKPPVQQIPAKHKQLTFTGKAYNPAISPDKQFVVYIQGTNKVIIRDLLNGQESILYTSDAPIYNPPNWSPDGSEILLTVGKELISIPRLGSNIKEYGIGFYPCWLFEGEWIASTTADIKEINMINKNTMEMKKITTKGFKWLLGMDWSSNRDEFLLITTDEKKYTIWHIDYEGKNQSVLFESKNRILDAKWSIDGDAIYLLKERDDNTNELVKNYLNGSEEILSSGMKVGNNFSITRDSEAIVYSRVLEYSNLWAADLTIDSLLEPIKITEGTSVHHDPSISPDNKWIVYGKGNNIFKSTIEGTKPVQLTFSTKSCYSPAWSPDGSKIAYSLMENDYNIIIIKNDGTYLTKIIKTEQSSPFISWNTDNQILYHCNNNQNFKLFDIEAELETTLVKNDSVGYIFSPKFSHDGSKIAVNWNRIEYGNILDPFGSETRGPFAQGLWIIYEKDQSQNHISDKDLYPIGWDLEGKTVYAVDIANNTIIKVPIDSSESTEIIKYRGEFWGADMSSDETKIVYAVGERKSDIWMMENFDPEVN